MVDRSKEEKTLRRLWNLYGSKGKYEKFSHTAFVKGIPNWMTGEYLQRAPKRKLKSFEKFV